MHEKLKHDYTSCNCNSCKSVKLSLENNPTFKKVLKTAEKAFKKLFEIGGYNPEQLLSTKEYQNLIDATYNVLESAITQDVPKELLEYLKESAFEFSALKTHAELTEARSYLTDEDGNIVPYAKFEENILQLNQDYNANYLEAEYLFATQSAQSAANWSNLENNTNRYWLQYRTAEDDRVRASHQQLAGVTLPKTDEFWSKFYPPNGWRCRCTAVEVLASKNTLSDSSEAIEKGEKATTKEGKNGKNTLEMFRFNPGKDKKLMPPKNTYSKVVGADKVKIELRKQKDNEIKEWAKKNIPEGFLKIEAKNFKTNNVYISRGAIKNIGDHFTNPGLKEVAKNIISQIPNCKYIESAPIDKDKPNYKNKVASGVTQYHYYEFEWDNETFRLNTEEINGKFEKPYAVNIIVKK